MNQTPPPRDRRTQIIATLGPASNTTEAIAALIAAGMDVARLNFSHADQDQVATLVDRVRQAGASAGRPVAILADLRGIKLRIGEVAGTLQVNEGDALVLTGEPADRPGEVAAPSEAFAPAVLPGQRIYLKDGMIELEVTGRSETRLDTVVLAGGELTSRAGLTIPGLDLGLPALTSRDRDDLRFAAGRGVEWIGLSFVASADDVAEARALVADRGADAPRLVAKIERRVALDRLEGIAQSADGLMVARGDLGVEVGVEEVPVWQHRILAVGARHDVPVIVATEMLESMRTRERPTRAEANDVAHAVWDGAAAVLLSAETAVGEFPIAAVETMDRIIRRAEAEMDAGHPPHAARPST